MSLSPDDILATELKKLAIKASGKEVGAGAVAWVARKMPSDAFRVELQIRTSPDTALRTAFSVLQAEGTVRDDVALPSEAPMVAAVVGSGFLGLNPALVTAEVIPQGEGMVSLIVVGMAKEGLIKQHGGEKAAKRIAEAIRRQFAMTDQV